MNFKEQNFKIRKLSSFVENFYLKNKGMYCTVFFLNSATTNKNRKEMCTNFDFRCFSFTVVLNCLKYII